MYQKPTAPRTIGGVLDDTLQLYVAALPRTWLPSLLVSVITVAVSYFFVSSIPLSASPTSAAELMTRYQAMIRAFGVLYIPVFILSLVFYGMMTAIVAAVARGASPTFGDALKLGVRRAPALFVASLVFGISIAIGFILLLIPGCYVWNRLQLFMVPVVAESKGPFESLGVSWRLVGGNWWRTATVVFVMFVILIVLQMCLGALGCRIHRGEFRRCGWYSRRCSPAPLPGFDAARRSDPRVHHAADLFGIRRALPGLAAAQGRRRSRGSPRSATKSLSQRTALAGKILLAAAVLLWSAARAQSLAPAATMAAARSALQNCVDRDNNWQPGLASMEQHCPDLSAVLQAAGIRPLIIESSRKRFQDESLHLLAKQIHPAAGPAPAVSALGPVLRELHATPEPPRSWWRRVVDWLAEHLSTKPQPDSSNGWLEDILRRLPRLQWLWTGIIWSTLIALPVLVVVVVVREVRALGKRSIDESGGMAETTAAARAQSRLALLRQAPIGQRPAQLFAMLISRLVAAGRLPPDRSLTHREVARRALLDDAEQRRLIESLARLSERQLYSGAAGAPVGVEDLLARGEDLYITGWGRSMVS